MTPKFSGANEAKDAFHAHGLPDSKVFSDAFDFSDDPGVSAAEKEGLKK